MEYYAHISDDGRRQTVAEHLTGTAVLCRAFAGAFGAEAEGELMGLAHDIGKCTDSFQKRLLEDGPIVDHATAGAVACAQLLRTCAAACVAGHHSGLPDLGNPRTDRAGDATLYGRLKKGLEDRYLDRCGESGAALPQIPPETPERDLWKLSFRTRMLYSCLVDADFLDTERFMNGEQGRGSYDDLPTLLKRLEDYIAPWQNPKTELNRLRCKMLNTCMDAGSKPKGIYTLTVPTGGGKTVASLAFALRHAVAHGMQRVIYVIPYTSIIEQNAEVFRNILGRRQCAGAPLRRGVRPLRRRVARGDTPGAGIRKLGYAGGGDNGGAVVSIPCTQTAPPNAASSTTLQTALSFSTKRRCCPCCHLRPCVAAMASLAEHVGSTLVLCTATQPSLGDLLRTYAPELYR